ncbi:MAG: gliding motility-associated C-terminal domain-containing protein [Burkholderiales bacterium]|nr:gliding motility-associated C-terminal domain-containing protein [Bacteroidia bacterium]
MSRATKIFLVIVLLQLSKNIFSQVPSTWTVNVASFQYQMTMTCKAREACIDLADTNNYIAAFVGTQCRGVVKTKIAVGANKLGLLTIKSNVVSGEKVSFQIYKASTNTILLGLDSLVFAQGTQHGTLLNPFSITTNHSPTDIAITTYTLLENTPLGIPISTLSATDPDPGTIFNFSLTNGQPNNSNFLITGNQLFLDTIINNGSDLVKIIEIMVDDNNGCAYTETFTLTIIKTNEAPVDIIIDTLFVIENNEPNMYLSKIRTLDNDPTDSFTYSFVFGSGDEDNNEFEILDSRLYILNKTNFDVKDVYYFRIRTTDSGGLSLEKAFEVKVLDIAGNSIPLPSTNYISPNGDNKNDYWKIDNVNIYKDFALQIFDQFGLVIYEAQNNYNNEFDGKYKGSPLPTGNYYYVFKNQRITYKGNITIVN